jgi:hypothetical protein
VPLGGNNKTALGLSSILIYYLLLRKGRNFLTTWLKIIPPYLEYNGT